MRVFDPREVAMLNDTLTAVEVSAVEAVLGDPAFHLWRRAAFAVQALSDEALRARVADREGAEIFAEMAIGIGDYVAGLRALAELVDDARLRVESALSTRPAPSVV
jgi:hypothetical protein